MRPQLESAISHSRMFRSSGRRSDRQPPALHVQIQACWEGVVELSRRCSRAAIPAAARPVWCSNFESFDMGREHLRLHWHRPSARGHASLTLPPALPDAAQCGAPPGLSGGTSHRLRRGPVQAPPHQTAGLRKSQGTASGDGPDDDCALQAVHAARCGRSGREGAAWRDHLHLPTQQDQPDHLLAARTAECRDPRPTHNPVHILI
jgi:hypothetical protein